MPRKGAFYYINLIIQALVLEFQIQQIAISMPVEVGKSYIPQKKPYNLLFESNTETERISAMRGSRRVLVKVQGVLAIRGFWGK